MNDLSEPINMECEEMLFNEYDPNQSVVIYSDEDYDSDSSSQYSNNNIVEFDSVVEDIFDDEEHFIDSDYDDRKYFIGLPCLMRTQLREWILQIAITPKSFFKYDYNSVMRYLVEYSVTRIYNPKIHIMQLDISNTGSYNVILKTFWLKIIQRTWKRIYKERQKFVSNCKNPTELLYRQLHGKWKGNKKYTGLKGMLCKN
jgi:hypothetical protein